jgi:hypothetical protein
VHDSGRDEILGTAYSDHDLVVFIEGASLAVPRPSWTTHPWVEWPAAPPKSSAPSDVREDVGSDREVLPDPAG